MKRFTLLVLSLLTITYAMADRISSKQAKQNVISFIGQNMPQGGNFAGVSQNAFQKVYESEGYYVFSANADNGFVIAAADDQMVAPVLGYTDEGNFDASNMPDAMKELLQNYDQEAKWLAEHPEAKKKAMNTSRAAIAPMLTTHWKQSPFYNDQCPMIGKVRCVTGCVATSAAQVMNFHKWPETGRGTHSYTWGKQQLTRDFSQSTYDWNSMTTRIDSTSSQQSKAAVAKLMSDVGIAVCMNYGEGSGAQTDSLAYALPTYFKYSREAFVAHRDYYTTDEWEQLAYESLQRREPICYGGNGSISSGHSFVCDGYKDGYFHINWGWDDGKDGYFLLTALNPDGIAPAGGYNPYVGSQMMLLNLRPDKGDNTILSAHVVNSSDFNIEYDAATKQYKMDGFFCTKQFDCPAFNYGLEFIDSITGKSEFHFLKESAKLSSHDAKFGIALSNDIFPTKDGVYKVYPAFYDINTKTNNRIRTQVMRHGATTITIKDGKVILGQNNYASTVLTCKNVTVGKFYADKYTQVKATIVNTGKTRHMGQITISTKGNSKLSSSYSYLDLEPGDSADINIAYLAPTDCSKSYELEISDDATYTTLKVIKYNVSAVPTGKFAANLTAEPKITIDEDFNVTVVADYACTSGFCDNIALSFFDVKPEKNVAQFNMQQPMGAGDSGSMTFKAKFDTLKPGTEYFITIAALAGEDYVNIQYGAQYKFTVKTPGTTDIEAVEEVVNDNDDDTIYDLQGRKVLNPRHGQIYIIHGKKVLK